MLMDIVPADVCSFYGVESRAPMPFDKVGLATAARVGRPIHGLRVAPSQGTSGWFLWVGEMKESEDFFDPVHVCHLPSACPLAIPFLGLPPGWRFITDGHRCDAWYDPDVEL